MARMLTVATGFVVVTRVMALPTPARVAVVPALALALLVYAGSYLSRSLQGRYEPAAWGTGGVKWYDWAPDGFVTDYKWNDGIQHFYFPLYILDNWFWHTTDEADSGRYPVNEVGTDDFGAFHRAEN